MDELTPKPIRLRPVSTPLSLVPFWPEKAETWFLYAEAEFRQCGISDSHLKLLAVVRALPRELTACVTTPMFSTEVSNPYELLKTAILQRNDLSDRQRLDELMRNIELGNTSAVHMLARMREVVGQRNFDEGLFRELFLSKLPKSVQLILATLHGAIDELAASADKILEISRQPVTDIYTLSAQPSCSNSEIKELCNTLRQFLNVDNSHPSRNSRHSSTKRSTERNRSTSKKRSANNPLWCWYHNTYGEAATRCRKPCTFSNDGKKSGN